MTIVNLNHTKCQRELDKATKTFYSVLNEMGICEEMIPTIQKIHSLRVKTELFSRGTQDEKSI